jgi:hypothetical protein
MININRRDAACGALFIAIGAAFLIAALRSLRLGGLLGMGPGFFPVMLGALLILLGGLIVLKAIGTPNQAAPPISWRGVALVTGSILFLALALRPLGFLPALFGSVFLASIATSRMSLRYALGVSAGLAVFSSGIFIYALGLPISLIGPLLGGY